MPPGVILHASRQRIETGSRCTLVSEKGEITRGCVVGAGGRTESECTIVVTRAVSASVGYPRPPTVSGAIRRVDSPAHVGLERWAGLHQRAGSDAIPSLDSRYQSRVVGVKCPGGPVARSRPDRRVVLFSSFGGERGGWRRG